MTLNKIPLPDDEEDLVRYSKREFLETRSQSFRNIILVTGFVTWLTSFRLWSASSLEYGFFFLGLLITLAVVIPLTKNHLNLATFIYLIGLMTAITVEAVYFPREGNSFYFYIVAIIIAGIVAQTFIPLITGILSIALVSVLQPLIIGADSLLTTIIWLAVTTILITVNSNQSKENLNHAMFYALQARGALEKARDQQGRLARAVKSLDESTSGLVKAYETIALAQNEAHEARQQKIKFANMISHELRAPLNFILGATQLMTTSPETYGKTSWPSGLHSDIQRVYQCSDFLLNLIEDVITLGQMETNKMDLTFEHCSISETIAEVVHIMEPNFENNGLYLKSDIGLDIPMVNLDQKRIRQVLLNLISNALRHTRKGGAVIKASLEGSSILVCVEDTGRGIPADLLPNLFQEFYQVPAADRVEPFPSSGLGLAISKQFIELHGGHIFVESPVREPINGFGPGTRFMFRLPLHTTNNIQALRIGQQERYYQRFTERTDEKRCLMIYLPTTSISLNQVPIVLNGYQLLFVQTITQLEKCVCESQPCGIISLMTDDETDRDLLQLDIQIPIVRCKISAKPLTIQKMWDAYLLKPVSMEMIHNTLSNLGILLRRCVVIDDDPTVGRFIELAILTEDHPVEVQYAENGVLGFELTKKFQPDVIFLDLNLPDISGWEVLQKIRADPDTACLPVVIFSALDNPIPSEIELHSIELITSKSFHSNVMNDLFQGIFDCISIRR